MTTHVLKCWPNAFDAVKAGRKRFEWRRDDRGYEVGDVLDLRRWDPQAPHSVGICESFRVVVIYILRGQFGVPENYCVMSIEPEQPR